MYKLIIFAIQLIALIIILSFIFTNPFIVSLDIKDLKYSFSSNILATISIVLIIIIYLFFYIYFKSRLSLNKYFLQNKYKKLEKG